MSATNVVRAGKRGMICVGNNVSSFAKAFSTIYISGDGVFSSGRTTIYICADYDLHLGGLRFTSRHTMIIHLDVTWKSCTLKTNSEVRGINL